MENSTKQAAKKFCNIPEKVDPEDTEERYYQNFGRYDGFIAGANWMEQQNLSQFEQMKTALEKIANSSLDTGRKGCNYNDTDFDSEAVVYGYNEAIVQVKDFAEKALDSLTENNEKP